MKTLENQTLLYDEDCPLCQAYTSAFVKTGILDQNGKKPFTKITADEADFIDTERAANEIALIDTQNKTVLYGIDSLLKVIGNAFPIIASLGKIKPVHFFLRKLYAFISYNRKVIIPGPKPKETGLKCEPSFNYKYRFLYILFSAVVTTLILNAYSKMIPQLPNGSLTRELLLATGQIAFQSVFLIRFDRKTMLNYVGNLMTVSLFGSLLLLPILVTNSIFKINETIVLLWFGTTVLVMLREHFRRVTLLELPNWLTATWIAYRIIALLLLLNL